ncbi:MAG: YqeG family HAD IIIA-type phosphatase [Rhodopirellula sp.]|nr:YqeG family HAD IIIA-type phosphatase [Rhodopirellula sp.]
MIRYLAPHLRIESVLDLGIEQIRALGLQALVLDVDCTLKRYCTSICTPEITAWVKELLDADLRVCLVSNGREPRISRFAEGLGVPYVARAFKPLPLGIQTAMRRLGVQQRETAMVGDQLFADIMAGRLAGVYTILVRPIQPEEEPWFTRLKRRPEAVLLRWMKTASPTPLRDLQPHGQNPACAP